MLLTYWRNVGRKILKMALVPWEFLVQHFLGIHKYIQPENSINSNCNCCKTAQFNTIFINYF